MIKYGYEYALQNDDVIRKRIDTINKNRIYDLTDMLIYRTLVQKLTKLYKKILFDSWNGYDYYDNEYIRDNFELNSNNILYPTIDHKISIFYGFMNDISIDDIAHIDNLCITKRTINSSKNRMCENEYIINKNNNSI